MERLKDLQGRWSKSVVATLEVRSKGCSSFNPAQIRGICEEGPSEEGPGEEGPGGEGPGGEGPCEEGPGEEGPCEEGPCEEGPREEGLGEEGPSEEGPGEEEPEQASSQSDDVEMAVGRTCGQLIYILLQVCVTIV